MENLEYRLNEVIGQLAEQLNVNNLHQAKILQHALKMLLKSPGIKAGAQAVTAGADIFEAGLWQSIHSKSSG